MNKDVHNGIISKAKTAKKKRPTLEEALKNRGIKSISKSKGTTGKPKRGQRAKKAKKNPYSYLTQRKQYTAWRVKNSGA